MNLTWAWFGQRATLKGTGRQQTVINLSTLCGLSGLLSEEVYTSHGRGPWVHMVVLDEILTSWFYQVARLPSRILCSFMAPGKGVMEVPQRRKGVTTSWPLGPLLWHYLSLQRESVQCVCSYQRTTFHVKCIYKVFSSYPLSTSFSTGSCAISSHACSSLLPAWWNGAIPQTCHHFPYIWKGSFFFPGVFFLILLPGLNPLFHR